MKRILILVLISLAITLFVTSCITLIPPAQSNAETAKITVTGNSEIKASPDVAYFTLSYESIKETSEEASQGATRIIHEAVSILKDEYDIPESDLETGYMSVSPCYEWVESERVLKGQRATQSIEVTDHDLKRLGALISELSKLDGISIGSVRLDKSDKSAERMEARRLAAENALERAEAYASGVGAKVGRTLSIGGSSFSATPVYANSVMLMKSVGTMAAEGAVDDAVSSTYYVGDVEISDSVNVVFELLSE